MLNPDQTFASLGLPTELVAALADAGINTPFPVQTATIPDALAGRDVLGRARTGSGKTLAFGLPLLTRLAEGAPARAKRPRALVLVPTRELALQVVDALTPLARPLGLWCRSAVGGMSFVKQVEALRRGVDLLVATPGRLSDHIRQGTCELGDIAHVAIDEADQMADMGFLPQVREILDLVDRSAQVLLFSATLDGDVDTLVKSYLTDPVTHSVVSDDSDVAAMEHHLLFVSKQDKPDVVAEMAAREGRTIMFVRTKHHVDRLADKLRSVGVSAGALHGGKTQGARNRVLSRFRDGALPVLVATDVAARGIHVDGVDLVVHVDPPADSKDYLHRAGRTARAGESGTVVTVVTHDQRRTVLRLTDRAGVSPSTAKVRPGDAELIRITGARTPSGEPLGPDIAPATPRRGDRPRFDDRPRRRPDGDRPRRFDRDGGRPRRFDRDGGRFSGEGGRFGGEGNRFGGEGNRFGGEGGRFGGEGTGHRRSDGDTSGPRRFDRDRRDRPNWFSGDDRPRRDNRFDPSTGDRPDNSDRPRFDRGPSDRPRRFDNGDKPRFDRDDRSTDGDRPRRFDRDDRSGGGDHPRRSDNGDKPRFDRDNRSGDGDRPRRFDNGDKPRFDGDKPRFDGGRPRFDGDRRFGDDRPRRFDRDERPRRFGDSGPSGRPRRFDDRGASDRPRRFDGDDRPRHDTGGFHGKPTRGDDNRHDDRPRKPRHSQSRHDRPADPQHPARRTPRGWREGDRRSKTKRY